MSLNNRAYFSLRPGTTLSIPKSVLRDAKALAKRLSLIVGHPLALFVVDDDGICLVLSLPTSAAISRKGSAPSPSRS